jgi:hypothetical protein
MKNKVIMVHLRQPNLSKHNELRSDPFWEFGSFGCTKCHASNLMNPEKIERVEGACLAFAQGGELGFKLVYLTPPVTIVKHNLCCEARWETTEKMPFRYDKAPLLVDNDGNTDFPLLLGMLDQVSRETLIGCFSSKFRSRSKPLPLDIAEALVDKYFAVRRQAHESDFAKSYDEALPYSPPQKDENREDTYKKFIKEAAGNKNTDRDCLENKSKKYGTNCSNPTLNEENGDIKGCR